MKKITIVSSDDIILYQPTILNLYDLLVKDFKINIVSFTPEYLGKKRETEKDIEYIVPHPFIKFLCKKFDLLINALLKRINKFILKHTYRSNIYRYYQSKLLAKSIAKYKGNIIIAVDPMPLYVTQKVLGSAHFLSLEIIPNDTYFHKIDHTKIISVIIQNKFRYEFLFKDRSIRTYYIQNAPMLNLLYNNFSKREGLIWAGTIVKDFAILDCLNFIEKFKQYKLTLKGAFEKNTKLIIEHQYKQLLDSNHVQINNEYLESGDFIKFISNFRIGFCFYNWEIIQSNYNYETAPSGKLFVYLAAGVPVIACNIKAFKFIETAGAGVLIDDYQPDTIFKAVQKIESDFESFSLNAYQAFKENCFDIHAIPFKQYLVENS